MKWPDWFRARRVRELEADLQAAHRAIDLWEERADAAEGRAHKAEQRLREFRDPLTTRERVEKAEATAAAAVSVAEEAERQRDLWCAKYETLRDGPLLPPPLPDRTPEQATAIVARSAKARVRMPFCVDCECPHPVGEHTKVSA